jgi:hypothetical protein
MIRHFSVSISNDLSEHKRNLPNHSLRQIAGGTVAAAQRGPFNKSMRPELTACIVVSAQTVLKHYIRQQSKQKHHNTVTGSMTSDDFVDYSAVCTTDDRI